MVIEHEKSSKVGIHTEWEKLVKANDFLSKTSLYKKSISSTYFLCWTYPEDVPWWMLLTSFTVSICKDTVKVCLS